MRSRRALVGSSRAVALLCGAAVTAGCSRPQPSSTPPRAREAGAPVAATDAAAPRARDAATADAPPVPSGPTGTIEGTVYLDGPIVRGAPVQLPAAWAGRPGCRDAALRYSQPFDISTPGPFPGALVSAEARETGSAPSTERRFTFRDCDITPRVVFARRNDRIVMHADTRQNHLPHIEGSGATVDQVLIPGQPDVPRNVPGPGQYPVTGRDMPPFVVSVLLVLPNRFIDTTDVAGHYRITDVPVGNVTVHAWYPGTVEAREVVAVRAGETAHADFHLRQLPPRPAPPVVDSGIPIPP